MIEKIMKAVKRGNKRRGRNITIGAVIGFLLSCTVVMGADSYLWIKGDSGEIKFNTTATAAGDGDGPGRGLHGGGGRVSGAVPALPALKIQKERALPPDGGGAIFLKIPGLLGTSPGVFTEKRDLPGI